MFSERSKSATRPSLERSWEIKPTPSGRGYAYVDKLGAPGPIPIDEISSIYG